VISKVSSFRWRACQNSNSSGTLEAESKDQIVLVSKGDLNHLHSANRRAHLEIPQTHGHRLPGLMSPSVMPPTATKRLRERTKKDPMTWNLALIKLPNGPGVQLRPRAIVPRRDERDGARRYPSRDRHLKRRVGKLRWSVARVILLLHFRIQFDRSHVHAIVGNEPAKPLVARIQCLDRVHRSIRGSPGSSGWRYFTNS
jgi:hypothetical protein